MNLPFFELLDKTLAMTFAHIFVVLILAFAVDALEWKSCGKSNVIGLKTFPEMEEKTEQQQQQKKPETFTQKK